MQNTESTDLYGKQATFTLFADDKETQFSELNMQKGFRGVGTPASYYVLWFDSKMKNYELFLKYIVEKRLVQCDIVPILVVDNPTHQQKVIEIWDEKAGAASA